MNTYLIIITSVRNLQLFVQLCLEIKLTVLVFSKYLIDKDRYGYSASNIDDDIKNKNLEYSRKFIAEKIEEKKDKKRKEKKKRHRVSSRSSSTVSRKKRFKRSKSSSIKKTKKKSN